MNCMDFEAAMHIRILWNEFARRERGAQSQMFPAKYVGF